jgi:hypothetical protein
LRRKTRAIWLSSMGIRSGRLRARSLLAATAPKRASLVGSLISRSSSQSCHACPSRVSSSSLASSSMRAPAGMLLRSSPISWARYWVMVSASYPVTGIPRSPTRRVRLLYRQRQLPGTDCLF